MQHRPLLLSPYKTHWGTRRTVYLSDMVRGQIEAVMDDLQPVAIKIGMINDIQIVRVISDCLQKYSPAYVVYDPVMVSTSGKKLMTDEAIEEIKRTFATCDINHSQHRRSKGAYR